VHLVVATLADLRRGNYKIAKSDGSRLSEAIESGDVFSLGCSLSRPDAEEDAVGKGSRKTTLLL